MKLAEGALLLALGVRVAPATAAADLRQVNVDASRPVGRIRSADPNNPASYNFAPTDRAILTIVHGGSKVLFNPATASAAPPST